MYRLKFNRWALLLAELALPVVASALWLEEPVPAKDPKQPPAASPKPVAGAATDPKLELRVIPALPPKGAPAYPMGVEIKGQELIVPSDNKESFDAYFAVEVAITGTSETLETDTSLLGSCCNPTGTCWNVTLIADRDACGASNFTEGVACGAGTCFRIIGTLQTTIREIVPTECLPGPELIGFREICRTNQLHPGGQYSAQEMADGMNFSSSSEKPPAWNDDQSRCITGFRVNAGRLGTDCHPIRFDPDPRVTRILAKNGRLLPFTVSGAVLRFASASDKAGK